jgi:hypothetical protein
MFARLISGKGLLITRLLPKSGHDKGDCRINLADEPLADRDKLVAEMSQRTRVTVERFRVHYVEWDFIRQE